MKNDEILTDIRSAKISYDSININDFSLTKKDATELHSLCEKQMQNIRKEIEMLYKARDKKSVLARILDLKYLMHNSSKRSNYIDGYNKVDYLYYKTMRNTLDRLYNIIEGGEGQW